MTVRVSVGRGFVALAVALFSMLAFPAGIGPARAAKKAATFHDDVVYAEPGGVPLTADIYSSTSTAKKRPVLVLVHGGSWQRGSKEEWDRHALAFRAEGFVVVAIDYRLVHPNGDALFPQPVTDVSRALGWVRRNIRPYGGDPKRVGILGGSAGAYLTLMAAGRERRIPDAVGLLSPPVMLRRLYHQGILVDPLRRFIGCVPEECPGRYAEASGLRAVGSSTPPVFLGFSRNEILPRNQGRRLDRELAAAGVDHVTYEMRGDAHSVGLLGRLFDETVNFFRDTL